MAQLATNLFSSYTLTEEEQIQGCILSSLQKQVIQNRLAVAAEGKVYIEYEPTNPLQAALLEAHARGQIDALNAILQESDFSEAFTANPTTTTEE